MKVYRLITRNSYEREMFDKASLKLGLDKAVLQDINRKGSLNGVKRRFLFIVRLLNVETNAPSGVSPIGAGAAALKAGGGGFIEKRSVWSFNGRGRRGLQVL